MYTVLIEGLTSAIGNNGNGVALTVNWDPNSDVIQGYAVYYGSTSTTATQLLTTIPITQAGFNPTAPSIIYDSVIDLKKTAGEQVCFSIKAYNSAGYSDASNAACIII